METTSTMAEKWQWMGSVFDSRSRATEQHTHPQKLRNISSSAKLQLNANHSWGRCSEQKSWTSTLGCLAMVTSPPLLVSFSWIALEYFNGSLAKASAALFSMGLSRFMDLYAPALTPAALYGYMAWVLFQAALYTSLPGKGSGQLTPAGTLLEYNINGFRAWQVTVGLAAVALVTGLVDLAIITDHWEGLLVTANVYGYLLTVFAYVKAHVAPSHAADRKFSGSAIYDFYMGIEMNPRFGKAWDWKLFHNGRPGIIGWTLM
jgi:7-dehydrocholesterol reductase